MSEIHVGTGDTLGGKIGLRKATHCGHRRRWSCKDERSAFNKPNHLNTDVSIDLLRSKKCCEKI